MDLFKLFGTIVVNNADANKALDETTSRASGVASAFNSSGGAVTKSGGGMTGTLKKVGAAVATYMSLDAIKNFGMGCIQAAADANAASSQFTQVFSGVEDQASKSLSQMAKSSGISTNRLKGSYTQIAAFAKTTGMETSDAMGLADRAMVAVADSAAFYDRSLEDTTESLRSFLKGNYENDAALGLSCTETTRNAAANKLYGKSFKDLSESQKQLTLLQMVEEANQLSGAMGQASRESNTWTNQTGNLSQAWKDLQGVLGLPVVDLATSAVGWLAEKIGSLTQKISEGTNPVQRFIDKISALKTWFVDIATYAGETFQPVIDDLSTAFTAVKDALQPFIDKLAEYVTGGGLAKDATDAIKGAIDFLAVSYQGIKEFITAVVQGFQDAVTWGKEHETALTLIAVAIGTLTTAIGAYNVAMAIKNAGGIAELAQLALLQVQIWGLTAAETAHTLATNIGTAATTAFGAAVQFLTSPITLVILAIGALIAVGVLLYQNWDVIKAKCIEIWDAITAKFTEIKEAVVGKLTELKDAAVEKFNELKDGAAEKWEEIKTAAAEKWQAIKDSAVGQAVIAIVAATKAKFDELKANARAKWETMLGDAKTKWESIKSNIADKASAAKEKAISAWNNIRNTTSSVFTLAKSVVSDSFTSIKNKISEGASAAWDTVKEKFESIKSSIKEKIEGARDLVEGAINKIKGFFNFEFKWPKLSLPHFTFTGSWNPFDWPDNFPSIGVSWYKKAMDKPLLLTEPTIFGFSPATGSYLGGGEAGDEVVAGANTLMGMIGQAIAANSAANTERLVAVLMAILEAITGGNQEMLQALLSGQTIVLDNREFGRAVRKYA